jgi:anti-sigma B factor antagonist
MNIDVTSTEGITIAQIAGEIDSHTSPMLMEKLAPHLSEDARIMLDMSGVTFMSSSGLRQLLLLKRQLIEVKGKVVLVGLSSRLADIMDITGFLDFFDLVETREAGIEALK